MICGYIADFFVPGLNLVLEADGPLHKQQEQYDAKRDRVMEYRGYHVLRFGGYNLVHNPKRIDGLIVDRIQMLEN